MHRIFLFLAIPLVLVACSADEQRFRDRVDRLVEAATEEQEIEAIAEIVRFANDHDVHYGYRVANETTGQSIPVHEIGEHLDEELVVTVLIGRESPYDEVRWEPKANWYITRLVMN